MTSGAEPPRGAQDPRDRHVVLLGMMGAGKTTTGELLAARLGRAFVDSDAEVEARAGGTGAGLAARDGVAALHDLESRILLEALARPEPAVIASAASVVDSPPCREALARAALVVWLDVPIDELQVRTASGSHRRPLPRPVAEVLLTRRWRHFVHVADLRVDGTQPTDHIIEAVVDELERPRT